jgi:hypothetical protein
MAHRLTHANPSAFRVAEGTPRRSPSVPLLRRAARLLGAALIAVSAAPARADEAGGPRAWHLQALVTVHRFIPDEPRADPDQPSLRYGFHGGRWRAMGGGSVALVTLESDALRLGLSLDGFIELGNFNQDEPVPWESYRANVGVDVLAESPRLSRALLPKGGRIHVAVGWFHESDHAANLDAYKTQYLAPRSLPGGFGSIIPSLDNANFSAYEYIKIRAVYRQPLWGGRLTAQSALGARLFPEPINPGSLRAMRAAVLVEPRLTARISAGVRPFVSAYYELVENDFVARDHGFRFGLDRTPLRYAIVSLGVDLVSARGAIMSPYVTYSNSHGRGIDFPKFFGSELGFGFVLLP